MSSIADSNRGNSPNEAKTTGAMRSRQFREQQKKQEEQRKDQIANFNRKKHEMEQEVRKLHNSNCSLEEHIVFFNRINNTHCLAEIIKRNKLHNNKIKIKVSDEVQMLIRQNVLTQLDSLANLDINVHPQSEYVPVQTLVHHQQQDEPVEIRDLSVSLEDDNNNNLYDQPQQATQIMLTNEQSFFDNIEPSMSHSDITPSVFVPLHNFDSLELQDPTDSMEIMNQFSLPLDQSQNLQQQQHLVMDSHNNADNVAWFSRQHAMFDAADVYSEFMLQ